MGENEDKKLSELIESAMLEAPPDDIARRVTPWRRAMVEIVLGLLLTTITFGRGFLYYVLTFAGVLLLLGGFRTLRRVNAGFAWCFRLTLLNTACVVIPRVLDAALPIYVPSFLDGAGLAWLGTAIRLLTFIAMWRALCQVKAAAGQKPEAPAAKWLIAWYILAIVLALADTHGAMAVLMIVLYAVLLWLLWRMIKGIEEAGYEMRPAPVRMTNLALAAIITAVTLLGIAIGLTFFDKYPMHWQPQEDSGEAQLRAELAELGFPEDVLADLTDEEVRSFEGAEYVLVSGSEDQLTGGWVNGTDFEKLRMTHVSVRLPGEGGVWRTVVHFNWLDGAHFYGTEAFQAWLGEHYIGLGFAARGPYSGRVLYDADGGTMVSEYYSLTCGGETVESIFGSSNIYMLTGQFSFPSRGENQRGYLIYTQCLTEPADGNTDILAQPHYMKVLRPFVYPAADIMSADSPSLSFSGDMETYGHAFEDYVFRDILETETEGVS